MTNDIVKACEWNDIIKAECKAAGLTVEDIKEVMGMVEELEAMDEELKCEGCGSTDETVHNTYCPYEEEIHDEKVPVVICASCYDERCMDV